MNMSNLMAQAQKMQKDIQKKQEELFSMKFTSNNEFVELILNGDKSLDKILIKNKANLDVDDLEVLEDMIKLAYNDAINQIDKETEKKLGAYSKLANGMF